MFSITWQSHFTIIAKCQQKYCRKIVMFLAAED